MCILSGKNARASAVTLIALLLRTVNPAHSSTEGDHSYEIITPQLLSQKTVNNITMLTYMIVLDKKSYVLHLTQNRRLISPDFKVFSYSKKKDLHSYKPHISTDCYYQGIIQDHPYSAVAFSTCSGLKGAIYTNGLRYAIEPDGPLTEFKHLIYRTDTSQTAERCGLDTYNLFGREMHKMQETRVRNKTAYVELFVVTTQPQFRYHDENETYLVENILELINTVDTIFQPLNTRIVLVGIEIWSYENLINTETGDADDILMEFLEWKIDSLDKRISCDIAGLSLRESTDSTSGLARLGGACSPNNAGFFSVMNQDKLILSSDLFVHELGHVLGMKHDTAECTCPYGKTTCIMSETVLFSSGFSDCSVGEIETFYANNQTQCLWNNPVPDKIDSDRIDCASEESFKTQSWRKLCPLYSKHLKQFNSEQLHCKSYKLLQRKIQCTTNVCCNPATCKLRENATCSSGPCCEDCMLLPRGTPCRTPTTECDLTEYCDGLSNTCPLDTYLQNGSPCNNGLSACYEKICYNYNEHCQKIFGKSATVAPLSCFQSVNTVGDRFGNCGTDEEIIQCETNNVMCGRVQCQDVSIVQVPNKYTAVIQTPIKNSFCWGIDFRFSAKDFFDFGAVPDGAQCDSGKICMNKRCVDISVLGYDCDVRRKCGGNGVCNNNKNCHCDTEWAPPNCTIKGFGGSIDSGPPTRNSFIKFISPQEHLLHNGSCVVKDGIASLAAVMSWLLLLHWLDARRTASNVVTAHRDELCSRNFVLKCLLLTHLASSAPHPAPELLPPHPAAAGEILKAMAAAELLKVTR
ncbi:disintegrin and metalloproteinase domain-containing protein 9-like [Pelodytes ibericus]